MAKVLIVEDDSVIADGMAQHLAAAGFDPIVSAKGDQGLARLRFERPDVVVLDLMLPERDGWSVIESARAEGIATPIVVVSARGTSSCRRSGDAAIATATAPSTCSCGDCGTRSTAAPRSTPSSKRVMAW